jgi:hypothetical protein
MNFHLFPCKVLIGAVLLLGFGSLASAQKPAASTTTPETALLNSLWDSGQAAGNSDDWYRNCDDGHKYLGVASYPQLKDYGPAGYQIGFVTGVVNAPRNVIGNASLGYNGMWGMVHQNGMTSSAANSLYNQYRANQHYFYPAVRDVDEDDLTARDLGIAMFPYATQTVGKSGSEMDEVRKFVHSMAAFKPAVKPLLVSNGLLIPTLQMVWRRSRVSSDAEYLSGLAHPTAFSDVPNDVAMIQLANGIDTTNIPPLVQLSVVEENFWGTQSMRYNDANRSEKRFTTPNAIARVFYGIEKTKRMVVSAEGSFDVNSLPLTYHYVVLRGDPGKVRITPLNAAGSRAEIEFDYHTERIVEGTQRLSNLVVVGVFVHNGSYYSAPAFISSLSLTNEQRTYGLDGRIQQIRYLNNDVNAQVSASYAVSYSKSWSSDTYTHDFNGRQAGWVRAVGAAQTHYSPDGLLVRTRHADGRPATVSEVTYTSTTGDTTVAQSFLDTDWRSQIACLYESAATPADTPLQVNLAEPSTTLATLRAPDNGVLVLTGVTNGVGPLYTYTPKAGFTGVDVFTIKQTDSTAQTVRLRRIRVVVGPADTVPPAPVPSAKVTGLSASQAVITWPKTTDNVEVHKYDVYRDGSLLGHAAVSNQFEDNTVVPGATYNYSVKALDDAGNESGASPVASGGGATVWGQDNFSDGNYTAADPNLANGLAWTLVQGTSSIKTSQLRVGQAAGTLSLITTPGSLAPPYSFEYNLEQAYVEWDRRQGSVMLYKDLDNYYYLVINKGGAYLYRRMNGVDTLIGEQGTFAMIHASSTADIKIRVVAVGGLINFKVTKSNWSVSPSAVVTASWSDSDPSAVSLFKTGGRLGFVQPVISSNNNSEYDNILISSLAGKGPDLDDDGLIDAWEEHYFGSTDAPGASPTADGDGDSSNNLSEQNADTDPTDPSSPIRVSLPPSAPGTFTLGWTSATGRTYSIMMSPNMAPGSWVPMEGAQNIPGSPPNNEVVIDLEQMPARAFFQIQQDP